MGTELGHIHKAAVKKQTNAWGGAAIVLGAGDGFEFNSEGLKPGAAKIDNMGINGTLFARPSYPGNRLPGGPLEANLYYNDAFWRALVAAIGADAVTELVAGATRHDITFLSDHQGINLCLALAGSEGVREMPTAKVTGMRLSVSESGQIAKASVDVVGHELNDNIGSPDDDLVVASAAAADGAKTIAAQPTWPSRITFTLTGVTELVTTLVGVDIDGVLRSEVHTMSTGGLTFTSSYIYSSVTSITCASIAGTGTFKAGVLNGVNNATTAASIATSAARDPILFSQVAMYLNAQDGAAFSASDLLYFSEFELGIALATDQRVTSRYGNKIEEPITGGAGQPKVTLGIKFSAYTSNERRLSFMALKKSQAKAKIVFTGPPIGATAYAHSLTIWLNGLQFDDAGRNVGGYGVLPFDLAGEAHSVAAAPTGHPAGLVLPGMFQLQNALATAII